MSFHVIPCTIPLLLSYLCGVAEIEQVGMIHFRLKNHIELRNFMGK